MTPTPPRRRWFQFSLQTMFVVVTALAIPLGWLAWNLKQVRERAAILPSLKLTMGIVTTSEVLLPKYLPSGMPPGKLPWLWRKFGAQPEKMLYTRQGELSDAEIARVRRLFPEAKIKEYPRGARVYTEFSIQRARPTQP